MEIADLHYTKAAKGLRQVTQRHGAAYIIELVPPVRVTVRRRHDACRGRPLQKPAPREPVALLLQVLTRSGDETRKHRP